MDSLDFLFVHVPKRSNYYKPLDEFMLINYFPVGILMMADLLEKEGYKSHVIHVGLEFILDKTFSILDWIAQKEIKIIGLPIHWHYQSYDVMNVAKDIKERFPHIHITLGGFTASRFAEEIIEEFPYIDSVVVGDGEKPGIQLVEAINSDGDLSKVENLVWREKEKVINNGLTFVAGKEEMKGLDFTNFSLLSHADEYVKNFSIPLFWMVNASSSFNRRTHFNGSRFFPLPVGRGCSVNCSFCGGSRDTLKKISGRRTPVFRPIEDVVQSMKGALAAGYNALNVSFDPLPAKDQYWVDLFELVRKEKIEIDMFFECWGLPTDRFVEEFKKTFPSKTSAIAISVETGSEKLRRENKGIYYDNASLYHTLGKLKEFGISTYVYFTIGLASETKEDSAMTTALIGKLRKEYSGIVRDILLVPIQIEPGAPIFEDPDLFEVKTDRSNFTDFYNAHGGYEANPYTDLGYSTNCLFDEELTPSEYSQRIQDLRCRKFCILTPSIFGKPVPALGRLLCNFRHFFWKRKRKGSAPKERPHF